MLYNARSAKEDGEIARGVNNMEKDVLKQYLDAKKEVCDLEVRIRKQKEEIQRMEQGCEVKDAVKGTRADGTIGTITVEGFPFLEYTRAKTKLQSSALRMKTKKEDLEKKTEAVEKYIDGIQETKIRRIFRYKYLDGLNWVQVAHKMGGKYTADGCRVAHDRYLKKNKKI